MPAQIDLDAANSLAKFGVPLSGNASAFAWDRTAKSVGGGIDVTLTSSEYDKPILELSGALTASINVILPLTPGAWWIAYNNTTGNYTLTLKGATGASVAVSQGMIAVIYCDGTNMKLIGTEKLAAEIMPANRLSIALSDADTTLTYVQAAARALEFTGALTAGRNIILPDTSFRELVIYNNTTGGFALTIKTSAGSGIAVAATKRAIVYCDGTNVVRVTPDT